MAQSLRGLNLVDFKIISKHIIQEMKLKSLEQQLEACASFWESCYASICNLRHFLLNYPVVIMTSQHVNNPSLSQDCRGWSRQTSWMIISGFIDLSDVWFIRNLASQISTIIILAFSQRNKISRLLWWIQQQDKNGLIWLGCLYFATFITFSPVP